MKKLTACLIFLIPLNSFAFDNAAIGTSGDILRVLLPAAAFTATYLNNDEEGRVQFYKSFLSNTAATYALKETIEKDRPDDSGNDSFPSGHASMAFQAAGFVQERYGRIYGLPAYMLAGYTAWSRLAVDEHDEEDIFVGAAIGTAAAMFFTTKWDKGAVFPLIGSKTVGLGLSIRLP